MYKLTFNRATIDDLLNHRNDGRQLYGAITIPYSGVFTEKSSGSYVDPPKIVCPYQVNDIIAIQERWARSSKSYVYATGNESIDSGYTFRPAYTAPIDSVRMYARIVSIKPWRITKGIAANYLTRGMSIESYAGTAKVVGYKDTGNRLLSTTRKIHNTAVLNKTYQPMVPEKLPMVIRDVPYYTRQPVTYTLNFVPESEYGSIHPTLESYEGQTTSQAQRFNSSTHIVKNPGDITLDYYYGDWNYTIMTAHEAATYMFEHQTLNEDGKGLIYRGEYYYYDGPHGGSEDPTQNVYIYCQDGKPIPRARYYKTEIVDPSKYWFAWLISAYLSDKEGNIIGKWY